MADSNIKYPGENYNLYDTDFSRYLRVVTEFSDSFGPVCTNSIWNTRLRNAFDHFEIQVPQ